MSTFKMKIKTLEDFLRTIGTDKDNQKFRLKVEEGLKEAAGIMKMC